MKEASLITHLRDIIILPLTVTVIIPYFIYNGKQIALLDNTISKVAGIICISAGLSLFLYTVYLFKIIGKGTLAPWSPKQQLVVQGPYRYCRNPMITGVLTILLGECLFFGSETILIWALLFFIINTIYFILLEEPDLYQTFGDEYKAYKKEVPRWIPRFRPYTSKK